MKLITFEMRKLTTDADKVLTNGEAFSDIGGSVILAVNDSPDNWYEITAEEAEKLQKEMLPEDALREEEIE